MGKQQDDIAQLQSEVQQLKAQLAKCVKKDEFASAMDEAFSQGTQGSVQKMGPLFKAFSDADFPSWGPQNMENLKTVMTKEKERSEQLELVHEYVTKQRRNSADERLDKVETIANDLATRFDSTSTEILQTIETFKENAAKTAQELQENVNKIVDELRGGAEAEKEGLAQKFEEFNKELHGKVQDLHDHQHTFADAAATASESLQEELAFLRREVGAVANLYTRQVLWRVKDVTKKFVNATRDKNLFSPLFDCGGIAGCQLQLRYHANRKDKDPSGYRSPPRTQSPMGRSQQDFKGIGAQDKELFGPADLSLYFWAPKDCEVVFRLTLGKKTKTLHRQFHARMPHGVSDFGLLQHSMIQEYDMLPCAVEIMEVKSLQVVEADPADIPRKEVTGEAEPPAGEDEEESPCEPEMVVLQKHLNHRIYESCNASINKMKDRLVRKVVWRIENASKLLERCPNGRAVASPIFNAAGIDGMQLVFYPCGYTGAAPGMCSFMISCPAGTSMNCVLQLKNQKRPIKFDFPERGTFGRTNFCRYEACFEPESDSISAVVEFIECSQMLTSTALHDTSGADNIPAKNVKPTIASTSLAHGGVVSQLKMERCAGSGTMNEIKELPSLYMELPADVSQEFCQSLASRTGQGWNTNKKNKTLDSTLGFRSTGKIWETAQDLPPPHGDTKIADGNHELLADVQQKMNATAENF